MRIHAMISSSANKGLLQDDIVTERRAFRHTREAGEQIAFPGIIHDRSSSGATLFIEPQAVVNMNNEIRELEMKEQDEIRRILAELSAEAGKSVRQVINNQKYLTKLDVIFAKGRLSVRYNGCSARINTGGILDIRRGRHPLIDPEKRCRSISAREKLPDSRHHRSQYRRKDGDAENRGTDDSDDSGGTSYPGAGGL